MLKDLKYFIGVAQPEELHREITKTCPLEPAVRAANYAVAMLDHHYFH